MVPFSRCGHNVLFISVSGSISVGKRPRASLPVSLDATTLSMTRNSIATTPTRPRPSQQRLSLTQPNLTAITRVNRPKKRKAKESTTESSSELPETVIGSYKKDRGLARNDRNPRSSLGIGRAGPSAKKTKPFRVLLCFYHKSLDTKFII
jgi:hypothetical protein